MAKAIKKKQPEKASEPIRRRLGAIILATAILENEASRAELCQTLFARFCPVFIDVSPSGAQRAYIGFCEDFAEIGDGERPPRYLFSVERDSLGKRSVTFSRMAPAEPVVSKPIRKPRKG